MTAPAPVLPERLACLAKHYSVLVTSDAGGFGVKLPDGATVPWDDGKTKTFEEKLADPDLEDALSIEYRPGVIVPVHTIDEDPGRIRVDALFRATYGDSAEAVRAQLVPWTLLGQTLVVHRKVLPAFQRVGARLDAATKADPTLAPFLHALGGTFVWRVIAGTNRRSAHSYGVSLDLDPGRSDYWRAQSPGGKITWRNRIPQAIVDAFEAEGFVWGGRWYHYDTMHFEYRPELFSPCP